MISVAVLLCCLIAPSREQACLFPTPDFTIVCEKSISEYTVEEIITILDYAKDRVEKIIGLTHPRPFFIKVSSSTEHFVSETRCTWWRSGITKGDTIIIQPVNILKKKGILKHTLIHEYTHVVVNQSTHSKCPFWFNEGLAVYMSGEISKLLNAGGCEPVTDVKKIEKLIMSGEREKARTGYISAYYVVVEMIAQHGRVGVKKFLDNFR